MTQQETHPTGTGHGSTPEPTAPQWYGEPSPFSREEGHQPAATATGPYATPGQASGEQSTEHAGGGPYYYGFPDGAGGPGGPAGAPPSYAPAPTPGSRPGRRIAELSAVAVLAAVLASGGTFAATKYGSPTSTVAGATSVAGSQSPAAPVIQADPSNPDWTATAKAVTPSVVSISVTSRQAQGQGSGVIIDKAGHILTNNHVATGAGAGATIAVTLSDGRTYDAKVVGTDPSTDLAVLALANPPADLTPISIGDSSKLTVGQPVMAVGNPLGLAGTVTTGIVSALNRPVTTSAADTRGGAAANPVVTNAIQTSAAINPGNSGGALVTSNGQLIGINSSIASLGSSQGGQSGNIGIGFAIPVNEAKTIADQLIKTGTAQHAYLGVSSSDTTVTENGSKRGAALVQAVQPNTPAATAGLQQNDAVVAINGQSIDSSEALVAAVHEHTVGDAVTVTVIRNGARSDLKVTLGALPNPASQG
ncbi:MAG: trypsin-like peptidase domain-containing protein [Actinomycetota bacterium]|nr:trypsin-like peptidase domain-containing protein [Actinomycetota bacterium]